MKLPSSPRWLAALFLAAGFSARATITVPSADDASDGDLILTGTPRTVVIDLSLAQDGSWDSPQTKPLDPALGGVGTYDSNKWAVVFKYNSVRIGAGVTVIFRNHDSRAPVVWLVKSNVLVDGGAQLDLSGRHGAVSSTTPEGGPGGFRGEYRPGREGRLRGYLVVGGLRRSQSLIPLLGGYGSYSGGGGAILIGSEAEVMINGVINLSGEEGGAIRIVADTLRGGGSISGGGIIRLEVKRIVHSISLSTAPSYPIDGMDEPVKLWPDAGSPAARIISVGNAASPADPRASLGPELFPSGHAFAADMTIRKVEKSRILIETTRFPVSPESKVVLFATPNSGRMPGTGGDGYADYHGILATFQSGNDDRAEWVVETVLPKGYTSLQVHAVGP